MAPNASGEVLAPTLPEPDDVPAESIRVENKVYSAKKLSSFHPGGPVFIQAFAGRDATEVFLTYHRRRFPHTVAKPALESTLKDDFKYDFEYNRDFFDLCERVEKVLPRSKSFAPWYYFVKATFLVATSVALDLYVHCTGTYRWWLSGIIGLAHALTLMNVGHDANHGTLSKKPWVNRLWAVSTNWCGASSISWIHQHVVQHHVHTNDIRKDPDIQGRRLLRLNPLNPLMRMHIFQHVYFFLLILLFGLSASLSALTTVVRGIKYTPISPLLLTHWTLDVPFSLFYFFRWFLLPQLTQPGIWTLLNCIPLQMVLGFYLALFFTLSHNFEGVVQVDSKQGSAKTKSLIYKQVATGSNLCGNLLCYINGGLNYQIEHHLFPRINHMHYPKIVPIVKEFLLERGYPYNHFNTIGENTAAMYKHLFNMGSQQVPKAAKDIGLSAKQLVS